MDTSDCTACGDPILWAVSAAKKKRMPLNPEPDSARGNVDTRPGLAAVVVLGPAAAADKRAKGVPLHLSHFVTCAQSAAFRQPRR